MQVKSGPHGLEAKARDLCSGHLPTQQIHQQGRNQRAMHDEPGIAFSLGHIAAVIVNAVSVEGECGVAKQQHIIRNDFALPRGSRRCSQRR